MLGRDLAVFLAAGTIAATLVLRGVVMQFLSVQPVADDSTVLNVRCVHEAIARAALRALDGDPLASVSTKVGEWATTWRCLYESWLAALASPERATCAHRRDLAAQRELSMNILRAQRRDLVRLQRVGALSHAVLHEVEVELDLAKIALEKLDWRGTEAA